MDYKLNSLEVIELMQPKIKKLLHQTAANNREDLEQKLNLVIIETMEKIKFNNMPSFSDLVKLDENNIIQSNKNLLKLKGIG